MPSRAGAASGPRDSAPEAFTALIRTGTAAWWRRSLARPTSRRRCRGPGAVKGCRPVLAASLDSLPARMPAHDLAATHSGRPYRGGTQKE